MLEKCDVNGIDTHPLFKLLRSKEQYKDKKRNQGRFIKENFTKYLLDKTGQLIGIFSPKDSPEKLRAVIESYLIKDQSLYSFEKNEEIQGKNMCEMDSLFNKLTKVKSKDTDRQSNEDE